MRIKNSLNLSTDNLIVFMKKAFRIILTPIFLFLLAYAGFTLYAIPSVRNSIALATTIKPETYTELYLEDHTTLPKSNKVDSPEWFKFTIHNLENKTMNYPYEVYIEDTDGNRAKIVKDIVKLNNDEYRTIPIYYELLHPVERAKIVIRLIDKDQSIHFWIGKSNEKILLDKEKAATESSEISIMPGTERSNN